MKEIDWTTESAWAGTRQPVEQASALPAEAYADSDFFAVERERVFGASWTAVALLRDLDEPGRVLVRTIGDRSVLITRNANGALRAFLNSCRHRGTELAENDCTVGNTIRCPYHRWGYDLDGNLIATPRFTEAQIEDFDPADFGLHAVNVDSWGPIVFVCLEPATPTLGDYLGDLADRMAGYGLDRWALHDRATVEIAANWKLISENFQEYYHLTWVHPELAKVSRVDDHYRYQGPGMYCGQTTTPVSSDERDDWTAMPPAPGLDESDGASGRFVAVFPNVLLSVLPNHAFVMVLEPLAPGRTREHCIWLVPDPDAVADEAFASTRRFWLDINDEDIDIVERAQRGIARGGYTPGRLSPRFEEPLHRFHNMVADKMVGLHHVPPGDDGSERGRYGSGVNPLPSRGSPA